MASAGSLIFEIAADVSRLRQDMNKAQNEIKTSMDSIARNTAISGAKAGFDFAMAFARAFGDKIKQAVDQADALGKLSERIGTTTEALSALAYAGKFADVSTDDLTQGFKYLNKALLDARDPASNAAAAFKALGLNVDQLKSEDPAQAFTEVAEAFSKYKDGAEKGAVATQLFGKEGQKLIPLLNSGADGIAAATAEAERLGMIVSTRTAQDMAKFNDQLTTIENITTGLAQQLAGALVPALTDVTNMMIEANTTGTPLQNAFLWIGKQASLTAIDIASLAAEVKMFINTSVAWGQIGKQVMTGQFSAAKDTYDAMRKANDEGYAELNRRKDFARQQAEYRFDPTRQEEMNAWAVVQANADRSGKAVMKYTDTLDKNAKAHKSAAKAVDEYGNMLKALQEKLRMTQADGDEMQQLLTDPKFQTFTKQQQENLKALAQANIDAANAIKLRKQEQENAQSHADFEAENARKALQLEYDQADATIKLAETYTAAVDPTIAYTKAMEELNALLVGKWISPEVYAKNVKIVTETLKQAQDNLDPMAEMFKNLQDAVEGFGKKSSDAFVDFVFGTQDASTSFSEMVASMLKDLAKMLVYQNVMKPLFSSISGGFSSGGFFDFLSGATGRMAGGPVSPGQLYQVNELPGRKEYFIPNVLGTIATDADNGLGNGGIQVNVHMHRDGSRDTEDTKADNDRAIELGKRISAVVKQTIVNEKRTGGLLAS